MRDQIMTVVMFISEARQVIQKCIHDRIDCWPEAMECSQLWIMEYACGCSRGRDKITSQDRVVIRCGVMVRVVIRCGVMGRVVSNVTRVMSDGECD